MQIEYSSSQQREASVNLLEVGQIRMRTILQQAVVAEAVYRGDAHGR